MLIYIIVFIITLLHASYFTNKKVPKFYFYGYCLVLGAFVGISDMLGGYDRYVYAEVFQYNAMELHSGNGLFNSSFTELFHLEIVYGLINSAVGYFTPNRYIFIFLYTLLLYFIISVSLYKYTKNSFMALILFLGLMFFFTFTYLRQVLACSIVWLSFDYVAKRKIWKFLFIVAIATMIHNSAIYFLLLYYIPIKKFHPAQISSIMIILFVIGLSGITKSIFAISGNMISNERISSYTETAESGFRFEYVLEAVLFLFILLKNYSKIKNDRLTLVIHNNYLMFCGILFFFCTSSDGGRIAWYGMLGIILTLAELCSPKKMQFLRLSMISLSALLFLRILIAWGILLYPYKTFFTNGIREGDFIYATHEYDNRYANDKFYNLWHE